MSTEHKKIIAENRKARFDYHLEEFFEAGIALTGAEVKSIRLGKCSLVDAFVQDSGNELYVNNMHISGYEKASLFQKQDPRRPRKLLLHRQQIKRLIGKIRTKGLTITVISIYFNKQNRVKLEIALAKGKKNFDKRETEKQRDWSREKSRILKGND